MFFWWSSLAAVSCQALPCSRTWRRRGLAQRVDADGLEDPHVSWVISPKQDHAREQQQQQQEEEEEEGEEEDQDKEEQEQEQEEQEEQQQEQEEQEQVQVTHTHRIIRTI